jgi:Mn-dependent DtxR family transcriptional regulator
MSKQKCVASNEKIADILSCEERKVNPKSVSNSVSRLEKAGCVKVILKPNIARCVEI